MKTETKCEKRHRWKILRTVDPNTILIFKNLYKLFLFFISYKSLYLGINWASDINTTQVAGRLTARKFQIGKVEPKIPNSPTVQMEMWNPLEMRFLFNAYNIGHEREVIFIWELL